MPIGSNNKVAQELRKFSKDNPPQTVIYHGLFPRDTIMKSVKMRRDSDEDIIAAAIRIIDEAAEHATA